MSQATAENDRRLGNVVLIGAVTSVDAGSATAVVQLGELTSPPLPVGQMRAGALQFWWMPTPGEQVVVVSPSGDVAQGVIIASIYAGNAPSSNEAEPQINLAGGKLVVNGDIEVSGDVVASGVSLVTHTHGGVLPGGANTGEPN